jgi:hypothetical protein
VNERHARLAAATAAVGALIGGAAALNQALVGVFYDDGLYAGIAVALSRGLGYVHPHLPGAPTVIHYPPLYPLVLAPLFGLLPLDAAAVAGKLLNVALGAAAAGITALHAVRHRLLGDAVPAWLPAAVVGAAAVAIPVLTVQSVLFSEPLFTCLLAACFLATDATPDAAQPRRHAVVAGGLAALALLTRSIGVAAAAGAVAWLWLVRGERRLVPWTAALPVVAAVGWGAWVAVHRSGIDPALALNYGSYADHVRQAGLAGTGARVTDLVRPLAGLTLGWLPGRAVVVVAGAAALAMGAYGLMLLARRSSAGATLVAYLAILVVWPNPPDRFLWAVLAWIGLGWAAGAAALWRHRRLRVGAAVISAILCVGYAAYQVRGFSGRWWQSVARSISDNFTELLPAVRDLPADAVVASDDEALVWLHTGRRAVPLHLFAYRGRETVVPDPAAHRAYLERQGVTHILLASASGESGAALRALMARYPDWLVARQRWAGGRWLFAVHSAP